MTDTPPPAAVLVRDVHKSFGAVAAVRGVDLAVAPGEFLGLLGPNGAGKTTLVEMIEGLQLPDRGEIRLFGRDWRDDPVALRRSFGLVLQENHFFERLSVLETLELFASFYGVARTRAREVLGLVGLIEKANAWTRGLSGGQRQRLAIGVGVLHDPPLLILDEPTTGLDPHARREIWHMLKRLQRECGTAVLLTTHYMEEAETLCERIVILDRGRVLDQGTVPELIGRHGGGDVIEFAADGAPPALDGVPGLIDQDWDPTSGWARLRVADMGRALVELMAVLARHGIAPESIRCRRMTLDDLFVNLTGRHLSEDAPGDVAA